MRSAVAVLSLSVFALAAVTDVSGQKRLTIRDVRRIQLTSNSQKVLSDVTEGAECVSIVQPKEPVDASLTIDCKVDGTYGGSGVGAGGMSFESMQNGWKCEGKLVPAAGGKEIWKKSDSGLTPRIIVSASARAIANGIGVESAPEAAVTRALDLKYVEGSRKILAELAKAACPK